MNTKQINAIVDYGNNLIMSQIFMDLIADHKDRADLMYKMHDEYDGMVEIKDRPALTGVNANKSNNKIANNYRGIIVDQSLAYAFGKPIKYELDKEFENNKTVQNTMKEFSIDNKMDDLDYSTAFYAGICGYGARLLYVNKDDGRVKVMNLTPWEVIIVQDQTIEETQFAMIYYTIKEINPQNKQAITLRYVEWYDNQNVYYYRETESNSGLFAPDTTQISQAHGFSGVPVILYKNNNSMKGDFEGVRELVDAYDRLLSDAQNELEDFRNAYMLFKGVKPDAETIQNARNTGALGSEDPEVDVSFITKDLEGTFLENQKKTVNDNIFKFSKRVDMNDEKFSGDAQSGESRKWKLLSLENDATIKESKFRGSNLVMFKLLESVWIKSNRVPKDFYLKVRSIFTRNLPIDYLYYGDILTKYWGKVPKAIIYGLMPFIENTADALKSMEEEEQVSVENYLNNQNENEDQNV